jgi:hypothetical protein
MQSAAISMDQDDGWHRVAVAGTHDETEFLALFATERTLPPDTRPTTSGVAGRRREVQRIAACGGELATDARMALLRVSQSGQPISLVLIDASVATWTGMHREWRIGPLDSAADLHLDGIALDRLNHKTSRSATLIGQ